MTKEFVADTVPKAIEDGKPITTSPLWGAEQTMDDGTYTLGLYMCPDVWLLLVDGLYIAGRGSSNNAAVYATLAEAIADRFGMTREK